MTFFFQKSCRLWDNMKKYGTARGATDDNIRWMRFVCCMPKATDTLTEYVILIVFPQQQWFCERASVLRYTYIACLVIFALHLQLCFSNGLFSSRLRTENFYGFLIVCTWPCCLPCPYRVPLFGHTHTHITFGEKHGLWSSSLCNFHHPLIIPRLLGSNVLLKVQWETMFLPREGTSTTSISTYPPQTRNTRNPTASRRAAVVPSMVGQFSQSVTLTLSKPGFYGGIYTTWTCRMFCVYSSVTARKKKQLPAQSLSGMPVVWPTSNEARILIMPNSLVQRRKSHFIMWKVHTTHRMSLAILTYLRGAFTF